MPDLVMNQHRQFKNQPCWSHSTPLCPIGWGWGVGCPHWHSSGSEWETRHQAEFLKAQVQQLHCTLAAMHSDFSGLQRAATLYLLAGPLVFLIIF
jgi:hypothetical protein